ncbi:hypothetical protein PPERSA_12896 [Pseudocohnilembus persalinus]|uniref:EF-hand domain-containing protein n=1 Tax=Pseudocohnilembus persalinus TaxID=266149 RepID=A0A0V0R1K6_PSEPJ|nr:hypothetical protein PPERSA_12896 [Pseudocohnilembus persalinus]|eukprot:KRX08415.1 hypothetical protein PPERSA_12896 [Pseudocohnilembus persalinus]
MDLNITGKSYTPITASQKKAQQLISSKKNNYEININNNKKNSTKLSSDLKKTVKQNNFQPRSEIHMQKHRAGDQGLNIQSNKNEFDLQVVGKRAEKGRNSQKQKFTESIKYTNLEASVTRSSNRGSPARNLSQDEIYDSQQLGERFNYSGKLINNNTENENQSIINNSHRHLNYSRSRSPKSGNKLQESGIQYKENVVLSGGFKIPSQSLEKRNERNRRMAGVRDATESFQQEEEQRNKRIIMQKMGILDRDVDEYFDVMDDRVYDREQDEEVHQILEQTVESKIGSVHEQRNQLLRRKEELERQKAAILAERQKQLDRLYGYKKFSSSNYQLNNFIDIQEQDYEESGQLSNSQNLKQNIQFENKQDVQSQQKAQQLIGNIDINTSSYQRQFRQQQDIQNERNQDQLEFNQNYGIQQQKQDDITTQEDDQNDENLYYDDEKIQKYIHEQRPNFEETEETLQEHRKRMRQLEEMYNNRKEHQDEYEEEQRKIQEKIKNGIMKRPLTQEEIEQMKFEEEFKDYVKNRKKNDERMKMSQTANKKEFDVFQSTSPNKKSWKKPTHAQMVENISSLYPLEVQKELRKQAREGKQFDNIENMNLTQSGFITSQQSFKQNLKKVTSQESEICMLQGLFDKLDRGQKGKIDKFDLGQEIMKNQELREMYNINEHNLNKELQEFKSQEQGYLTPGEMTKFFKKPRKMVKAKKSQNLFTSEIRQNKAFQEEEKQKESLGNCLLSQEHIQIMKQIFDQVDKDQDWVIRRQNLIKALRQDIRIARILHLPAVYLANIDKQLTTDRVLYRIEKEEFIGNDEEKKNKEFITWAQFLDYFTDIQNLGKKTEVQKNEDLLKSQHMKIYSQFKNEMDDQDTIEINENVERVLKEAFEKTEKHSEIYVNSSYFIENVRMHPEYQNISGMPGRIKAVNYELEDEQVNMVLDRMEQEAEEFLEFDEIMEFFSRRGRPKAIQEKIDGNKYGTSSQGAVRLMDQEQKIFGGENTFKLQQQFLKKSSLKNSQNGSFKFQDNTYSTSFRENNGLNFKEYQNFGKSSSSQNNQQKYQQQQDDEIDDREYIDAYDSDPETYQYHRGTQNINKPVQKLSKLNRSVSNNNFNKSNSFGERSQGNSPDMKKQSKVGFSTVQINQFPAQSTQSFYADSSLNGQRMTYQSIGGRPPRATSTQGLRNSGEFKITKPQPFQFDERERQRQMTRSISQRRFDEMIDDIRQKEYETYNQPFRANPVPAHVKKPLFQKLMHNQEKRRADVRANSIAITISREKPFSFYQRDIEKMKAKKKNKWEREQFVFKANKVPWFCNVDLLDRINNEEDQKRKERVAKEAQRIMQMSKLPPRMEMHEQQKKAKLMRDGIGTIDNLQYNTKSNKYTQEMSFQPQKAKPIPDFQKLQKKFQDDLDHKRQSQRTTEVKPFNFQETRKAPPRDYLDQENTLMKQQKEKPPIDKIEYARRITNKEPDYMPPSTKKFESYVKKQKELKEKKEKEEQEKQKQLELKEKRRKEAAKKFRASGIVKDRAEETKVRLEQQKQAQETTFKKQAEEWKNKKQEIKEKVASAPYLVERPPIRDKKLAKLKALNKMHQTCIKNKMTEKEMKEVFTKEELLELEDLQFIKKRYPKYFEEIELQV